MIKIALLSATIALVPVPAAAQTLEQTFDLIASRLEEVAQQALAKKPHPHDVEYAVPSVRVIDGDTIEVGGKGKGRGKKHGRIIRLVDIDAGETIKGRYKCDLEKESGLRAKKRMQELLDTSKHEVHVDTARGKRKEEKDKFGRTIGSVTSDGVDVGKILVSEGLAKPWDGHGPRPKFCYQ